MKQKTISIILVIMTVIFFFLWFVTATTLSAYRYEQDQLNKEWCEFGNANFELINELLDQLEYYDDQYIEVIRANKIDCSE